MVWKDKIRLARDEIEERKGRTEKPLRV